MRAIKRSGISQRSKNCEDWISSNVNSAKAFFRALHSRNFRRGGWGVEGLPISLLLQRIFTPLPCLEGSSFSCFIQYRQSAQNNHRRPTQHHLMWSVAIEMWIKVKVGFEPTTPKTNRFIICPFKLLSHSLKKNNNNNSNSFIHIFITIFVVGIFYPLLWLNDAHYVVIKLHPLTYQLLKSEQYKSLAIGLRSVPKLR